MTEFLGRDRYQPAAAVLDAQPGSRNGYQHGIVKTTAGLVTLQRFKVRGSWPPEGITTDGSPSSSASASGSDKSTDGLADC